jgi:hypothetical protein
MSQPNCPISKGKSYEGETSKSMKVAEMALAQEDCWRKIPITLIDLGEETSAIMPTQL